MGESRELWGGGGVRGKTWALESLPLSNLALEWHLLRALLLPTLLPVELSPSEGREPWCLSEGPPGSDSCLGPLFLPRG